MEVIKKGSDESYKEFYTDKYEFRLCGGSVEPKSEKKDEQKKESK